MEATVAEKKLFVIQAYKENKSWYVDDDNGFSKADNQLVGGVPEIIEFLAGTSTRRVRIEYCDEPFENSKKMMLVATSKTGSTYTYTDEKGQSHAGWLCPVFFWYFPKAPEHLYITVTPIHKTHLLSKNCLQS